MAIYRLIAKGQRSGTLAFLRQGKERRTIAERLRIADAKRMMYEIACDVEHC
jgi:hypothetical protein